MQIEEEILNELRGLYRTSFYSIYMNGSKNIPTKFQVSQLILFVKK